MKDIREFDKLLLELFRKIQEEPHNKHLFIIEVIKQTECPYLKEKVKEFLR